MASALGGPPAVRRAVASDISSFFLSFLPCNSRGLLASSLATPMHRPKGIEYKKSEGGAERVYLYLSGCRRERVFAALGLSVSQLDRAG